MKFPKYVTDKNTNVYIVTMVYVKELKKDFEILMCEFICEIYRFKHTFYALYWQYIELTVFMILFHMVKVMLISMHHSLK